jgi:FkbM family methyltransferase
LNLRELYTAYAAGHLTKADYIAQAFERHRSLFEYVDRLPETAISRIEICDDGVVLTARDTGFRLHIDRHDARIIPLEALNFGAYENDETAMCRRLVAPGALILDIGANIGWTALHFATCAPDTRVWCFEPIPGTRAHLERNLALNGIANVTVCPFGLADKAGELTFYCYKEGFGNASLANVSGRDSVEEVVCSVRRLDEVVLEHGLTPSFLKVDVEGAELFVLRGALQTLRRHTPVVFAEMLRKWAATFDYHPNEIIDLLDSLGYAAFTIDGAGLRPFARMDENTRETNFLFLHRERHTQTIQELVR